MKIYLPFLHARPRDKRAFPVILTTHPPHTHIHTHIPIHFDLDFKCHFDFKDTILKCACMCVCVCVSWESISNLTGRNDIRDQLVYT